MNARRRHRAHHPDERRRDRRPAGEGDHHRHRPGRLRPAGAGQEPLSGQHADHQIAAARRRRDGTATNWKSITAITGSGFDNTGWVAEGQRAGVMSYTTAASRRLLRHDRRGRLRDVRSRLAAAGLRRRPGHDGHPPDAEDHAEGGDGGPLREQQPAARHACHPDPGRGGSGATLPALTYSVIVVALTGEGYQNSSLAGGVATSKTVTGADGLTFTLNGGSSQKSAAASQAVTLGQTLSASPPPSRARSATPGSRARPAPRRCRRSPRSTA
jgi:hypothetical protein